LHYTGADYSVIWFITDPPNAREDGPAQLDNQLICNQTAAPIASARIKRAATPAQLPNHGIDF
jgi:hypothetical protein